MFWLPIRYCRFPKITPALPGHFGNRVCRLRIRLLEVDCRTRSLRQHDTLIRSVLPAASEMLICFPLTTFAKYFKLSCAAMGLLHWIMVSVTAMLRCATA